MAVNEISYGPIVRGQTGLTTKARGGKGEAILWGHPGSLPPAAAALTSRGSHWPMFHQIDTGINPADGDFAPPPEARSRKGSIEFGNHMRMRCWLRPS